jgi:peptide/nickel transport system permease protein
VSPAPQTTPRGVVVARLRRVLVGLAGAAMTVVGVASVVFFAFRLLPGDPADLVLGDRATPAERALVHAQLHLDEPIFRQYLRFLGGLWHGQFGPSLRHPELDASRIVVSALPETATLAACAVALGAGLGIVLALVSVGSRVRVARVISDRVISLSSSVPLLAFAPAATWLLAVRLRWVPLPADPDAGVRGLLFAAVLLAVPLGAAVARVARSALHEARRSPFLQVARAKGRSELAVWLLHALPVCMGPIVTVVAAQLGALLGGAIVLERILERRGLGTVLAEALAARDLPVVEGTVVISAALFVVAQGAGQRLHAFFDPRARE